MMKTESDFNIWDIISADVLHQGIISYLDSA